MTSVRSPARSPGVEARSARAAFLMVVAAGVTALAAEAGTICGTVRDGSTLAPIPGAGVFVRYPAGAYTGFYAATDAAGAYCAGGVPNGTYDLEIRVNDYQTTYVRDVVVTGDQTGIDADAIPSVRLRAWPNPARDRLTLYFDGAEVPASLEILDIRGRLVRGWRIDEPGPRSFVWTLRDAEGSLLPAGVYVALLRSRARADVRKITVLP